MSRKLIVTALIGALFLPLTAQAESYCAIEIGSKGVKARLYELGEDAEGYLVPKTHYKNDANTSIVASIDANGNFTPAAIEETTAAVKTEYDAMLKEDKNCQAFVVGSSGAAKGKNGNELVAAIEKATGLHMNFITADEEAQYGFFSSVPTKYRDDSVLIDVGSGNTKIAYQNKSDGAVNTLEVPFGTVSLAKAIMETNPSDFAASYKDEINKIVAPEFRASVQSRPGVLNRKRIYWIGGVAWATATYTHPEASTANVVRVFKDDMKGFEQALISKTWLDRKKVKIPEDAQKAYDKDWKKVQDTFTRENLLSALGLTQLILDEGHPENRVNFLRNGQWIFGYTREKFAQDKAASKDSAK
jgi:hypothetical protein